MDRIRPPIGFRDLVAAFGTVVSKGLTLARSRFPQSNVPAFVTIATTRQLPRAVILRDSLRAAYGEEAELVLFHLGEPALQPLVERDGFHVLGPQELAIPTFWDMAFRYDQDALARALRPMILSYVLRTTTRRCAVLLGVGTVLYDRLQEVHSLVKAEAASIIIASRFGDGPGAPPAYGELRHRGVVNPDFLALRADATVERFLAWWSAQSLAGSRDGNNDDAVNALDLVPSLFDNVRVLRTTGYGTFDTYDPDRNAAAIRPAAASRLRFLQFDAWWLEAGESADAYVERLALPERPRLRSMLADYGRRWAQAAASLAPPLRDSEEPFIKTSGGSPIPAIVKRAYARSRPVSAVARDQLFGPGARLVMGPSSEVPALDGIETSELYVCIARDRSELRDVSLFTRAGQVELARWIAAHAADKYGLPEDLIEPARRTLAREAERQRLLEPARERIQRAYEKAGADPARLANLLTEGGVLVRIIAETVGVGRGAAGTVLDDVPSFFRAVGALAQTLVSGNAVEALEGYAAGIEGHGEYLASKYGLDLPAFLASGAPFCEVAVEVDAVRNVCAILIDLTERRLEFDAAEIERDGLVGLATQRARLMRADRRARAEAGSPMAFADGATQQPTKRCALVEVEAAPTIVYVSGEPHTPGHLYRVVRQVEAASLAGIQASWIRLDDVKQHLAEIAAADLVVIWRAPWDMNVALAAGAARTGGATIVFDVDDLIIEPDLARAEIIDGIRSSGSAETSTRDLFRRFRRTMLAADACSTTTEELAQAMRAASKPTFIIPNGFDHATLEVSDRAVATKRGQGAGDGLIRIGYASGSMTHQRDFGEAAEAVAHVLRRRPQCRLVLFRDPRPGIKLVDEKEFPSLIGLDRQIEWQDYVSLTELPKVIAEFDINLAPLQFGNPFCEAKSELKFFEAALVQVPTIASPTGPYRRAIRDGATGFLAANAETWEAALLRLVDDPALRRRVAVAARRDVLWRFGTERRARSIALMLRRLRPPPAAKDGSRAPFIDRRSREPSLAPTG